MLPFSAKTKTVIVTAAGTRANFPDAPSVGSRKSLVGAVAERRFLEITDDVGDIESICR